MVERSLACDEARHRDEAASSFDVVSQHDRRCCITRRVIVSRANALLTRDMATYVTALAGPTLILHGDSDQNAPVEIAGAPPMT